MITTDIDIHDLAERIKKVDKNCVTYTSRVRRLCNNDKKHTYKLYYDLGNQIGDVDYVILPYPPSDIKSIVVPYSVYVECLTEQLLDNNPE